MNKTFIIPIFIAVLLGSLFGKFVFDQYSANESVFYEQNKIYFLEYGSYESIEEYDNATKSFPFDVMSFEDGRYYCYVAITKDSNNIDTMVDYFNNLGIEIKIKEKIIDNFEFVSNLAQYDILLNISSSDEEIKSIMETILASYEELVLTNE